MQIINISAMNRPARSLTSSIFPAHHTEAVQSSITIEDAQIRDLVQRISTQPEAVASSISITDASIRDSLIRSPADKVSVKSNINIMDAILNEH